MTESWQPSEAEIDVVVAEFDGDLRATIRALLHDLAILALDGALAVSHGYVRGRWPNDPPSSKAPVSDSGATAKRG